MPQDAYTLHHTAIELNSLIGGARIDKINEPDNDTVVLDLRSDSKNVKLLFCLNAANARVCLTSSVKENPAAAAGFCMLLRKHITRAEIVKIEPVLYERIIKLTLMCKNEMRESGEKILYAEIMGKYSNLILVENGVILGALKQTSLDETNLRHIFSGQKYTLPPPQNKVELSDAKLALETMLAYSNEDSSNFIFEHFKGLSKQTAAEIVFEFRQKFSNDTDFIINFKTAQFVMFFKAFYDTHKIVPNIVYLEKPQDFFIKKYESFQTKNVKYFSTISECVDEFFTQKQNAKLFDIKLGKLKSSVNAHEKKLNKKMQIILEKELSAKSMDDNRLFGELIIANLYRLKGLTSFCEVENYYLENSPTIKIPLDDKLTAKQNAERYFKKYDKQKKTLKAIAPQKEELLRELDYVASLYKELSEVERLEDFDDIQEELISIGILKAQKSLGKKQRKKISAYRSYSYLGYEVFVGKNNLQNDRLTLSADRSDIFLHTKDYHSSHVIIRTYGKDANDAIIKFAAEICAYYSHARESDKVPVDYALKKYVKKPSGLPVGKVLYTNYKTILVKPNKHEEHLH